MASGTDDPRTLDNAALVARIEALQKRAFDRYEAAAAQADDTPDADAAARLYAQAEADCAPWIAEARALNDERVRRLRLRARCWWIVTAAIAVAGAVALAYLMR